MRRSRPGHAPPRRDRPTPGRAAAWLRRWPRTPSTPGSTGTTGRPGRTCARVAAPCTSSIAVNVDQPASCTLTGRAGSGPGPTRRGLPRTPLGSRGRSSSTACAASPGGSRRPAHEQFATFRRAFFPLAEPFCRRTSPFCARAQLRRRRAHDVRRVDLLSRPTGPRSGSTPGSPRVGTFVGASRHLSQAASATSRSTHRSRPSPRARAPGRPHGARRRDARGGGGRRRTPRSGPPHPCGRPGRSGDQQRGGHGLGHTRSGPRNRAAVRVRAPGWGPRTGARPRRRRTANPRAARAVSVPTEARQSGGAKATTPGRHAP